MRPGEPLVYGQSITDACIGWDATVPVLRELADAVRAAPQDPRLTALAGDRSRGVARNASAPSAGARVGQAERSVAGPRAGCEAWGGGTAVVIKLVFCLRRLPHLSRAEFQRYWRETHAPLVEEHRAALRIERYVQLHTADTAANALLRGSRDAPKSSTGSPSSGGGAGRPHRRDRERGRRSRRRALLEDERRFIDLARSPLWLANEHEIFRSGDR